ncbi:hemerythrin domain-containing protein [Oceanicola sp. D3]|nr:hemerythrin domain-containing protein [Oceanicola sp. D3]
MQTLLRATPRESWPGHPNFAASVAKWMGAHQMFRDLARVTREDTEAYLDKEISDDAYTSSLARFGDRLVRNLHGHHAWEDRRFFPELNAADNRFEAGLEMLESDHVEMDALLERFTRKGNRIIQLAHLDPPSMAEEAGGFHNEAVAAEAFLARHLTDEEDLVVPIILHHKLRG